MTGEIGDMFEVPGDRLRQLTADLEHKEQQVHYLNEELQKANDLILSLTQDIATLRSRLSRLGNPDPTRLRPARRAS